MCSLRLLLLSLRTQSAYSISKLWLLGSAKSLIISLLSACIMLQKNELQGRLFWNPKFSIHVNFQKQHYHEHVSLGDRGFVVDVVYVFQVCVNVKEIFILTINSKHKVINICQSY